MSPVIPSFRIYSEADALLYTFSGIFEANLPQDPIKYTEVKGIRGQGSIIIKGSLDSWDLILKGCITGTDYEDIVSKIDSMVSTIDTGTKYYLRLDKTGSTTYEYKVMRLEPIEFQPDNLRTNYCEFTIKFRVNTWV